MFETLYKEVNEDDWLKGESIEAIEESFIQQAPRRQTTPETQWILAGDWIRKRPDIVKRLRANTFKNLCQKKAATKTWSRDMIGSGSSSMQDKGGVSLGSINDQRGSSILP